MSYTTGAEPEAEARVGADLARVTAAVRDLAAAQEDPLRALWLLGSFARGEGAVVPGRDGRPRGFNDYDFLLVFDRHPARPDRYAALSRELARELEIDFVDLGVATPVELDAVPPTLFWYELGEVGKVLWEAPGTTRRPSRVPLESLDPAEGSRLLVNRGIALLWAGLRLWPRGLPGREAPDPDPESLRFAVTAAHKAVLAAGDAALLRAGRYHVKQIRREERLNDEPEVTAWADASFLGAYRAAAAFRRRPAFGDAAGAGALWIRNRAHHEAGFAAAEASRLGKHRDWPEHAARIRTRARARLLAGPRPAARALRHRLRHGTWSMPEDTYFERFPELLYRPADPGWRERAQALIQDWHP